MPAKKKIKKSESLFLSIFFIFCLFFSQRSFCAKTFDERWIASAGAGVMVSPTLALFTAQLEYAHDAELRLGPLFQAGLGGANLFTFSWGARFTPLNRAPLKPFLEGALGIAAGWGDYGSGSGIHALLGLGLEYSIDRNIAVATTVRGNLCPPLQTAVLTWPLLVGRFNL